jgi:hypothetical protein
VISAVAGGPFCPNCGKPVVAGAAFCPSCGAALPPANALQPGAAGAAPLTAGGVPPTSAYPRGFAATTRPTPDTRATDLAALSDVTIAAVLALVEAVIGVVGYLAFRSTVTYTIGSTGSITGVTISTFDLYVSGASFLAAFALGIAALFFYRGAFHTLAPTDARFSTPSKLTLLAIIAIVIIILCLIGLVVLIFQAISCAGAGNTITSSCLDVGAIAGLALLLVLFAIVWFVGFIGLMIGVWRLGTRYDQGLFKVGAILLIIPFLSFVGAILILVAARSAHGAVSAGGGPAPSFG